MNNQALITSANVRRLWLLSSATGHRGPSLLGGKAVSGTSAGSVSSGWGRVAPAAGRALALARALLQLWG